MNLLFLTTNNLATNPRLAKELKTAIDWDATLTVAQFKLGNWSDEKSEQLSMEVIEELRKKGVEELRKGGGEELKSGGDGEAVKAGCSEIVSSQRIRFIHIEATNKNRWEWIKWGLLEKIARRLYPVLKKGLKTNALASSRRSFQLQVACKKIEQPDLIVAHNLGALYPAYLLGKKWQIPFIFDVEDYHPGEFISHDAVNEKARREFLMKTLLPNAAAITSASPLIGEYTMKLIGGHPNHTVILNSFPQNEFIEPSPLINSSTNQLINPSTLQFLNSSTNQLINSSTLNSQLKLVWFSQKISFGRGLEQLFDALTLLINSSVNQLPNPENSELAEGRRQKRLIQSETINPPPPPIAKSQQLPPPSHYPLFSLTLIGDLDPLFNTQILQPFIDFTQQPLDVGETMTFQSFEDSYRSIKPSIDVVVKPPISQQLLHQELANHDVGLALEPGKDLNNNLAISNKIIAYAQAGLYILATDTPAQNDFMAQEPNRGMVCGQTAKDMAGALMQLADNKELIKARATERFEKGKLLAWENERGKLEETWEFVKKQKCTQRRGERKGKSLNAVNAEI